MLTLTCLLTSSAVLYCCYLSNVCHPFLRFDSGTATRRSGSSFGPRPFPAFYTEGLGRVISSLLRMFRICHHLFRRAAG